ncbi:MAG: lysostaphin resistance A-like protein [Acidimicrobiales bacterium]
MSAESRIRWAVAGLLLGFVASVVVGAVVVTAGGYDEGVPAAGSAAGRAVMQLVSGRDFHDGRMPLGLLVVLQVPLWVGLVGAPVVARRSGLRWREQMCWSMAPIDVPLGLAVGAVTQLVLVPALYVPIFRLFGSADVEEAARSLVGRAGGTLDVVALVAITLVGAPVAEEIMFRGLLHNALRARSSLRRATVVSAVLFGVSHFQVVQFPALVLVGVIHALLSARTGRLGTAIWAHVGFNAVTVVALLT